MMKALAKVASLSRTPLHWRNTKRSSRVFTELTQTGNARLLRANLWPNTPTSPFFLQPAAGAFLIRAALGATFHRFTELLRFELCENAALPNKEEYFDSEKYQWKERDGTAPGNIKDFITRSTGSATTTAPSPVANLKFHRADNDQILFYSETTTALDNILLIVFHWIRGIRAKLHPLPVEAFGWLEGDSYQVTISCRRALSDRPAPATLCASEHRPRGAQSCGSGPEIALVGERCGLVGVAFEPAERFDRTWMKASRGFHGSSETTLKRMLSKAVVVFE